MNRPGAVLAVCGLAVEARLAAGPGVRTLAGGGRSQALVRAIEGEVAAGAAAIMSFGLAGALAPTLRSGTLLVAGTVFAGDEAFVADAEWTNMLLHRLPTAQRADLAGSDSIVGDGPAKAALYEHYGALAVDMESHIAARIAAAHGLPFAALRAIADPLDRAIPPAATAAMSGPDGIDVLAVLRSLARGPWQLPLLLRVARDARKALGALARGRRLLGDRLGYPDLDQLALHVV